MPLCIKVVSFPSKVGVHDYLSIGEPQKDEIIHRGKHQYRVAAYGVRYFDRHTCLSQDSWILGMIRHFGKVRYKRASDDSR